MRILFIKLLFLRSRVGILFLCLLSMMLACVPKPKTIETPNQIQPPILKEEGTTPKALWFTGANFVNGGFLGRLDLKTGVIKRQLLRIGPDTIVVPNSVNSTDSDTDSNSSESLFVLSRGGQDSMAQIKNTNGEIAFSRSLPPLSNPQAAVMDFQGQVWVSFLELNEVHVYSKDLKSLVAQVDLSTLALNGSDNQWHADLGPLAMVDENTILVGAQRLHRDRAWAPDIQGGFAFINTNTYQVTSTHLTASSNPVYISTDPRSSRTLVVGKGDLSHSSGNRGQFLFFSKNKNNLTTASISFVLGKIIAADWAVGAEEPALIVWYPQENKSCVQLGTQPILCDGSSENSGYIFSSIRQRGNIIFVAYYGIQISELWMITVGSEISVQKIPMDLPIFSLSFGP